MTAQDAQPSVSTTTKHRGERPSQVWAVIGATGTGKSALSLDLAEQLGARGVGAEVVNADAMQLYRGMDIGTAKLPVAERRGIAHHLLDACDVTEDAAVAWYQPRARAAISEIHARGHDAILVGGSGLYVSAVLFDFRFPARDAEIRQRWERELDEHGPGALFAQLSARDPGAAARVDPHNGRRLVRALEILDLGGATYGGVLPEEPVLWHAGTRILGLHMERDELVGRLDRRVEQMWRDGLTDEVDALRDAGLESGVTARRAIGYAQALAQLRGELSETDAIAQTQALTRRYARRQRSWFQRYPGVSWHDALASEGGAALSGRLIDGEE